MQLQMKQITGLLVALKQPFSVSTEAPENPEINQVWFDPESMAIYIYILDTNGPVWVEIA
jgi:hypothetical protein